MEKIMLVNVNSEFGRLTNVLVASTAGYIRGDNPTSKNNPTCMFFSGDKRPHLEDLIREQNLFFEILKKHDIRLTFATLLENASAQVFTRDIAFVIGDKFFVSNMRQPSRKIEREGITDILKEIENEIIEVPSDIYLEGGDVLVHGKTVYVGEGLRTTKEAIKFLKDKLGCSYEVVPIKLKKGILHLDVVFTIVGENLAIVYTDGIYKNSLEKLKKSFDFIMIDKDEQFSLGTNVLCINKKTVVVQKQHTRIIKELEKRGFSVESVDFSQMSKRGGALRCTTCPLFRED